jgi:hypothetical protein
LVLLILAVVWMAVLLPPYLQSRSESRPADSISSFKRQLSVLERRASVVNPARRPAAGSRPSRPRHTASYGLGLRTVPMGTTRTWAQRRRRDVALTLVGAAGLTFMMALMLGGPVWGLHLLCDVLLGAYLYLVALVRQRAIQQSTKVRYLAPAPAPAPARAPALLLRRSGS